MPRSPPVPIWAGYWTAVKRLVVVFDQPIAPGPLEPLNWSCVWKGGLMGRWQASHHLYTTHKRVAFLGDVFGVGVIPGYVDYRPPPADVTGRTGVPVAVFRFQPLVVYP